MNSNKSILLKEKMLKNLLPIVILLICWYKMFCLVFKPTDLCNVIEKECIHVYITKKNYELKCFDEKCQTPFNYKCENNKCAKNKTVCENFQNLVKITQMLKHRIKHRTGIRFFNKRSTIDDTYKSLVNKISNCPKASYIWNPNDFCISGRNCFKKTANKSGSSKKNALKRVECHCNQKNLTYVCDGNNYCARNKKACGFFVSKQFRSFSYQHSRLNDVHKCENDYLLY